MELINCPICDSNNSELYISLKDRFNITNQTFLLVRCECSFIYLNPRPNQNKIKDFYDSNNYTPHSKASLFYRLAQSISFKWKFKLIKKYINKNQKILDYGSGKGEFSNYIEAKLAKKLAFSIDNYEPVLNHDNFDCKEDNYQIITLWHSLEHIHNLNEVIKRIKLSLIDAGYIFIAIPNINAAEKSFFKDKWVAYDAPRHLYHFNKITLNNLLNKHGLRIAKSQTIFQDTFYNIYLSIQSNNILIKILKFIYISLISVFNILLNKNKSSSILYTICKK